MRLYSRVLWLFVLLCHALAAGAWFAMTPGGFGIDHTRFWTDRAIPAVLLVLIGIAVVAARRGQTQIARDVLALLAVAYLTTAGLGVALFPLSGLYPALGCVAAAGVVVLAFAQVQAKRRPAWLALPATVGALIGATMIATQRAAPSTTRPLQPDLPASAGGAVVTTKPAQGVVRLSGNAVVHPGDGSIDLTSGRAILSVHPLLTFTSRSPDRFWTCFATRQQRQGPARTLVARHSETANAIDLRYADDAVSSLDVTATPSPDGETVDLTATSTLPADVYSHLNTFTQVHVAGHRRLSIAFSPCPRERVPFTSQDAAPARFAYVDADRRFHIVQARASEKGPFRTLASGTLRADEPLTITLFDDDDEAPLARFTLHDWAAQASTALSPTAGWGVPQNAIEFSLSGASDRSTASIYITLAATSVGRGFESVGHAPGTYVNRMEVELPPPTPTR